MYQQYQITASPPAGQSQCSELLLHYVFFLTNTLAKFALTWKAGQKLLTVHKIQWLNSVFVSGGFSHTMQVVEIFVGYCRRQLSARRMTFCKQKKQFILLEWLHYKVAFRFQISNGVLEFFCLQNDWNVWNFSFYAHSKRKIRNHFLGIDVSYSKIDWKSAIHTLKC